MLSNKKMLESETPVRKIETQRGLLDLWAVCRWTRLGFQDAAQDTKLAACDEFATVGSEDGVPQNMNERACTRNLNIGRKIKFQQMRAE